MENMDNKACVTCKHYRRNILGKGKCALHDVRTEKFNLCYAHKERKAPKK